MGIVVPFALRRRRSAMVLPEDLLPDPQQALVTALFLGTALSIASVKIVAMVVREMNFLRRTVGQVILASAIIDDSVGWIIVSIIFVIALHGAVEWTSLAWSVSGTFVFMVVSFTIGRRVVFFVDPLGQRHLRQRIRRHHRHPGHHGRHGADHRHDRRAHRARRLRRRHPGRRIADPHPSYRRAVARHHHGVLRAGVLRHWRACRPTSPSSPTGKIALLTAGLILIASIGKFGGAFSGAKLGGLTPREGFALACGMNARGSTEVIVATIGLSMGALNQNLFTMIVAMAVITTMAMPPTLRWALSRIPLRKEEKQRLEREELEERGFVPNLERLLVAVDDSANGKFASRVAGMLAGTHGMPTTVLHIPDASKIETKTQRGQGQRQDRGQGDRDQSGRQPLEGGRRQEGASQSRRRSRKSRRRRPAIPSRRRPSRSRASRRRRRRPTTPVDVTTIVHEAPSPEIIAAEAEKGYDLMIIGLEKTSKRDKEFHASVTTLARGFEGPLAVSAVRDDLLKKPDAKLSILVPVNGTEASRNGAEVAITMARATKAPVTVLYVAVGGGKRTTRRNLRTRRHEEAILKDIVAIADGYNMSIRTAVLADRAADEAIMREVERRKHNLVVMGVGRRPGEKLFFGDTAAALLEKSERSLLFVAS